MIKQILCTLSCCLFILCSFSQAPPQALNYSAIAKGSNGQMLANKVIGLRFTILAGGISGTVVYQETQTDTTDPFGIFNTAIGIGTVVQGAFASISWGTNTHFLKVELDENGGSNYFDVGTSQLLSVPYALYAGTAGSADSGTTGPIGPTGLTGPTGATGPAGNASLTVASTQVFSGIAPSTWTDLDLSAVVGTNYALVILKVSSNIGDGFSFRQNGDTLDIGLGIAGGIGFISVGASGGRQVLMYTDVNGVLEWISQNQAQVVVEVVTYIN